MTNEIYMLITFGIIIGWFITYELFHIFMMLFLSSTPYENIEEFIKSHSEIPQILKITVAILSGIIIGPFMWEYKYHTEETNFQAAVFKGTFLYPFEAYKLMEKKND